MDCLERFFIPIILSRTSNSSTEFKPVRSDKFKAKCSISSNLVLTLILLSSRIFILFKKKLAFLKVIKENQIRYSEVFVSAFSPEHQQLFYEFGFRVRGYVPCWSYRKEEGAFEDYVVFNYYEGEVPKPELLPAGQELVDMLNLQINL